VRVEVSIRTLRLLSLLFGNSEQVLLCLLGEALHGSCQQQWFAAAVQGGMMIVWPTWRVFWLSRRL